MFKLRGYIPYFPDYKQHLFFKILGGAAYIMSKKIFCLLSLCVCVCVPCFAVVLYINVCVCVYIIINLSIHLSIAKYLFFLVKYNVLFISKCLVCTCVCMCVGGCGLYTGAAYILSK